MPPAGFEPTIPEREWRRTNALDRATTGIDPYLSFFCGEGPRSRCYGRTAALRLIVQPCDEDDFLFLRVMEHWWNENDRGKPKYPGKNLAQRNIFYHKSHMD
jgi:hypothetical protein